MPSSRRGHRPVLLVDLVAQRRRVEAGVDDAIRRVVEDGRFVLSAGLPVSETSRRANLSSPMHPSLSADDQDRVVRGVVSAAEATRRRSPRDGR